MGRPLLPKPLDRKASFLPMSQEQGVPEAKFDEEA